MPTLQVAIDARKGISGARQFNRALAGIAKSAKTAAGAAGVLTVAMAAAGLAAFAAVRSFASLDDKLRLIKVSSGATAQEMGLMKKAAEELATSSKFSVSQVADGFLGLSRAGQDAKTAVQTLPPILHLAAASMTDVKTTTDGVLGVLAAFGFRAEHTAAAVDVLQAASTFGNATLTDFIQTFKRAASVARTSGVSFKELAAAAAVLGKNNIKGSVASTGLSNVMLDLANVTPKVGKELARVGLTAQDVDPAVHGLAGAFKTLQESEFDFGAAFSKRAVIAAGILGRTADEVDTLANSFDNVGNRAKNASNYMESGAGGALRRMANEADLLGKAIGEVLAADMADMAGAVTQMIKSFREWVKDSQTLKEVMTGLAFSITKVVTAVTDFELNAKAGFFTFLDFVSPGNRASKEALDELLDRYNKLHAARKRAAREQSRDQVPEGPSYLPGVSVTGARVDSGRKSVDQIREEREELKLLQAAYQQTASIVGTLGQAFEDTFFAAIKGGEDFRETMAGVADAVVKDLFRILVTQKLVNAATSAIAGTSPTSESTGLGVQAKPPTTGLGGASKGGYVQRFGSGGLTMINQRTRLGPNSVGGEGGRKEAVVLPLGSNSSGEMGVRGGGGGGVTMIVNTPDANSFRRSRRQIAEKLRRAGVS